MEIKAYKCEVCEKVYEELGGYEKCSDTHKNEYKDSFVDEDLSISVTCKKSNIRTTYELGIEKEGCSVYFDAKEIEKLIEELNKRTPQTLAIKFAMDRISGKKVIL